ncbi:MAG: hypothetical protein MN733_12160 [Nitrososphaera sp.]|nr:hypothetical protein [Nitrososphaera sp.]
MDRKLAKIALNLGLLLSLVISHPAASNIAFGMSIAPPVALGRPQLLDVDGHQLDYITVGHQGVIRITINNNLELVQPFVLLTEVRDGVGVTEFIALDHGFLQSDSRRVIEFNWVPEIGCSEDSGGCNPDYEIRAFVISDYEKPQVLTGVQTLQGITVRATDNEENEYRLYRVYVDDVEYDVEYVIGNGDVKHIIANYDYRVITVQLENVTSDTELTIVLSEDLLEAVYLPQIIDEGSDTPNYVLDILVDGESIEPSSTEISEMNKTWVITIHEGSEEVEFVLTIAIQNQEDKK